MALFFGTGCAESDDMTWQPPYSPYLFIERNEDYTQTSNTMYTLEQLLAVRQQTIEECAKVCEQLDPYNINKGRDTDFVDCADAIRKLGGLT
jgi:hypothetical protein